MSVTSLSSVAAAHPGVPNFLPDQAQHRRMIANAVNRHNQGKFNATIDITLAANTGATLISDNRIGYNSAVSPMMAMSKSAAFAIACGMWFDTPTVGFGSTTASIVAHHTASSVVNAKIRFGIIG